MANRPSRNPLRRHQERLRGTSYPKGGLVARILPCERSFGDGPPLWSNAPTCRQAQRNRLARVKRLRRYAHTQPGAEELADILDGCAQHDRCKSGACPECCRAFQRWLVSEVINLASNESSLQLAAVSIAFAKHRKPEDQLNVLSTTKLKRSISEAVKSIDGLAWMVGGVDLSLNDDSQKKQGIAWQPQLYGVAQVTSRESLSKLLGETYSPSKTVARPVRTKDCDGSARAISYAFKSDFVRRIAYRGQAGPPGNQRKFWTTRKVSLRATEHVQAMLWLHRVGLAGRLYLRGVRMTRAGKSVSLVQIKKLE
jgi:hypothetical protein